MDPEVLKSGFLWLRGVNFANQCTVFGLKHSLNRGEKYSQRLAMLSRWTLRSRVAKTLSLNSNVKSSLLCVKVKMEKSRSRS